MFQVTSGGSNTTAIVNLTVTGTTGGTLTYSYATVTGVTLANAPLDVEFTPCMPASAPNTAIAVSLPSLAPAIPMQRSVQADTRGRGLEL